MALAITGFLMTQDEAATNSIPAFVWEAAGKDGLPEVVTVDGVQYYDGNWSCIMDANASVDYIVNYSMPSFLQIIGIGAIPVSYSRPIFVKST